MWSAGGISRRFIVVREIELCALEPESVANFGAVIFSPQGVFNLQTAANELVSSPCDIHAVLLAVG